MSVVESGSSVFVDDVAAAGSSQVSSEVHWSLSILTAKLRLTVARSPNGHVGCKSTHHLLLLRHENRTLLVAQLFPHLKLLTTTLQVERHTSVGIIVGVVTSKKTFAIYRDGDPKCFSEFSV